MTTPEKNYQQTRINERILFFLFVLWIIEFLYYYHFFAQKKQKQKQKLET